MDELYNMLNGSTVYSLLDYTSRCHHNAFSPEAQNKSSFVTLIDRFEFKKVPFGLAEVPTHFQQLINEVLKVLSSAFGYIDDILIFSENTEKHF